MVSVEATVAQLKQFTQEAVAEAKAAAAKVRAQVVTPKRFEKAADGATRSGQAIALLLVGPMVVVSLTIIKVINGIMGDVLGAGTIAAGQVDAITFLVTFLTLGLLVICAWGWFQFVRTAGFGAFTHD